MYVSLIPWEGEGEGEGEWEGVGVGVGGITENVW